MIAEGTPLFVSPLEVGALDEKLTPSVQYALKAFFQKHPANHFR